MCKVVGFINLSTGVRYGSREEYVGTLCAKDILEEHVTSPECYKDERDYDMRYDQVDDRCPWCGSYEGRVVECPECGHGQ